MSAEGGRRRPRGPDFLGIGSSRCGTTYLHAALRRHPQLWLPPVKELHFFDRMGKAGGDRRRRAASGRRLRQVGRAWLRGDANAGADARFLVRHRFGAHDLDGYRGWFRAGRGRLCGEITPAYSTLDDERIALIREAFPDLRLLFVMRDPIDRAWSAAYKSLVRDRGRAAAEVTREEWERKLGSRGLALRSDYLGTLERWGRHFPGERIWAGFFEDLVADPDDFVARIARFLGVDPPPPVPGSGRARNASGRSDCPPEFERLLAARFVDMNRQLHERYGSHATSWYHRTLRVLDREVGDRAATARQPI